jgi:hypothetical protein
MQQVAPPNLNMAYYFRNQELFIQFANMLMSDVTYLLDESLTRLTEIKGLEEELEHPSPELAANPVSSIYYSQ